MIEAEQEQSLFIEPRESLISTADFFEKIEDYPATRFRFGSDTDSLIRKIWGLAYRWLDSLAEIKSYTFEKNHGEIPRLYKEIFEFLRNQGMADSIDLKNRRYNDTPAFSWLTIHGSHSPGITDGHENKKLYGTGFGKELHSACSRALGEYLERYFLTIYRRKDLLHDSLESLRKRGGVALDVTLIDGRLPEKSGDKFKKNHDDNSMFFWAKGERVLTGEAAYIPAQLVFWNYSRPKDPPEPFLQESNTNGCGGYFTKEGAILSGLYELIQRDAFLIFWLNQIAPPRIDPESVPDPVFQNLLAESRRYGFEVQCLNTTLDTTIPSFMVVLIDLSGKGPRFCLGGGCGSNPVLALRKTLEEAWGVYHTTRPLEILELPKDYQPFNSRYHIGQKERMRLWANPVTAKHGEFFISGPIKKFSEYEFSYPAEFSSQKEELSEAATRVESLGKGYEIYAYMAQSSVLSRLHYFSAAVSVPQLVPLYLCEHHAPLGSERIKSVPQKLGIKVSGRINPWPHSFS